MVSKIPLSKPVFLKKITKYFSLTRVCLVLVIGFILFFISHFYRGYKIIHMKESQISEIQTQIEASEAEFQRLIALSEDVDSQQYIERIAREQLGLVKKGEILIIPLE